MPVDTLRAPIPVRPIQPIAPRSPAATPAADYRDACLRRDDLVAGGCGRDGEVSAREAMTCAIVLAIIVAGGLLALVGSAL